MKTTKVGRVAASHHKSRHIDGKRHDGKHHDGEHHEARQAHTGTRKASISSKLLACTPITPKIRRGATLNRRATHIILATEARAGSDASLIRLWLWTLTLTTKVSFARGGFLCLWHSTLGLPTTFAFPLRFSCVLCRIFRSCLLNSL